jgi:hypothetical protein
MTEEVGVVKVGEAFGTSGGIGEGRGMPEVFRIGGVKFCVLGLVWVTPLCC